MAAPLSKNWTKQPPYRAQINSGHPLAAGLRFAHTGSAGLVDLISQKTATKNASDSIQSVNIPNLGPAVSFKGGRVIGGGIDYGTYQASKTGAITLLIFANPTIGTAQTLFSQRTGASPFAECTLIVGYSYSTSTITSGVVACVQGSGSGSSNTRSSTSSSNTYTDGLFHAYAVTVQDGSSFPVIYFDGKSINVTTAGTGTSSFYNSAQKTKIGNVADYTADAVYAASCNIPLVLVWDRALSASEVAELSKNPWQLFRPQSAPVVFFAPATNVDALLANDLQSLSQLSSPAVGQKHALLANDLQSTSSVQTVTLGQKHVLLANDLESTSSVQTVALGQKHVLLANDLESLSQLSQPALTSSGGLLANDLESTSSVQTVALGQKHNLLANDLESTSSVQTIILSQKHVLLANDLQNLSQISSPAIGGGGAFALLANDLESATQLSIPVLRQKRQVNYATSVTIASLNGVTFYHNGGKWYGY